MRKIQVLTFLSLDGVLQAPGGPQEDTSGGFKFGGWTAPYFDEFAGRIMGEQMKEPFALLLGRKTYDIFAGYWPGHADAWPGINSSTKYVVTKTLKKAPWENSVIITGEVVDKIKKLKLENGPDMKVYGSGNLIQTLFRYDLVDELWLKIFPVVLGRGKRLFAEGAVPVSYTLVSSQTSPTGVIFANYLKAGEVKTGSLE